MSLFIYNLVTQAYFFGIKLGANWSEKARLWAAGRVGVFKKLESAIPAKRTDNQQLVWMHCASLGEFEQGRTVIEMLKTEHPNVLVLLTFFSPSGYEIRKNYPSADWVFYLPPDSKTNAKRFLEIVRPDLAIFVKYEFWYHYLIQLRQQRIPSMLISAIFRPSHPFFRWYGKLHRTMLRCFTQILVQDINSQELLSQIGIKPVQVAGDTRVDRVLEISKNNQYLPLVKSFCGNAPVLVCGSTWPEDEALLYPIFTDQQFVNWKFILAPHDVQPAHIQAIESRLTIPFVGFSKIESTTDLQTPRLLLVDNIGWLSSLYAYGKVAFIGGGFGKGIHNTLEPAAHGLPVMFGPNYQKFEEAVWMVGNGGAFAIKNQEELRNTLHNLTSKDNCLNAGLKSKNYVLANKGTTVKVVDMVRRFLDNNTDS